MNGLRFRFRECMVPFSGIITLTEGGGRAKVETTDITTTTPLGQELMDLQKAYEQGIITEEEYKEAKEKIIKRRTKK